MSDSLVEEFRQIENAPGYYISNLGRVKSIGKAKNHLRKNGEEYIMKPYRTFDGYPCVSITLIINGELKTRMRTIHRLIAKAFIPNPLNLPEVAHIDGSRDNFEISNLMWCSRQENQSHRYAHGTIKKGEEVHSAILKESDVFLIIELYEKYKVPQTKIAKAYRCSSVLISSIITGKTWSYLTGREFKWK